MWPALVYGAVVAILALGMLALSYLLGERHASPQRDEPYESGIRPTDVARVRYGARYYLIALFFILFNIEVAIVIAWAVAFRELGWTGYIEAALFLSVLLAGLVYVWRLGGLDLRPKQSVIVTNHEASGLSTTREYEHKITPSPLAGEGGGEG